MVILKKGEKVDWQYGGQTEYITDKDIEALKAGLRAVIDFDGEYTIVLKYRKEQENEMAKENDIRNKEKAIL